MHADDRTPLTNGTCRSRTCLSLRSSPRSRRAGTHEPDDVPTAESGGHDPQSLAGPHRFPSGPPTIQHSLSIAEGGGLEPHAGEDAHSLRMRSGAIARSPSNDSQHTAEGGGLEPHTAKCPPGSSRRRCPTGSPSMCPGRESNPHARRHRVLSAACLPFHHLDVVCPGRESNSHALLERQLLRLVCLPVVPPPGHECSGRESNSHGPQSPLASRASVSTGRFHHPSKSVPGGTRTPDLLVRNQALSFH